MVEDQITNAALRAIRRILRAADQGGRKLAVATGLTPSQLLVLQEIDRRGETTPGVIATSLQFGQATVTNILDRLEAAGLATRKRSNSDKRRMLLHVTTTGHDLLANAPDLLQEHFRNRFGTLPAWERAMILAALERLGELLDATEIDAAPLIDVGIIDRAVDDDTVSDPSPGVRRS